MAGPPVAAGAILLGEDGRILAAGASDAVPAPPGVATEQLADAVLMPGLVNAHTHLELTGFDGLVPEDDFPAWIRRIRQLKQERSAQEFRQAARDGLRACWAAGVTTIADTGDSGAVIEALHDLGGSGVAAHEVFGPHPDQCADSMAGLRTRITELRRFENPRVRLGVSPHAPYTVSAPLYREVVAFAVAERLPMVVHLAESVAESELLQGRGAFADAWRARGIPLADQTVRRPDGQGVTPVGYLDALGVLGRETLCIHLVMVEPRDIDLLSTRGVGVAHCPRSNARHGHGNAPLRALLDAPLRVGVGTDSVASVAPLDLLAECRSARRLAGLDAWAALRLATTAAAAAIGFGSEVGALTPGRWGDVAVFAAPECSAADAAAEAVLGGAPVIATIIGGRTVP